MARNLNRDRSREMPGGEAQETNEMAEEEVDETLAESFPASDPPSWTLGTDHRSESSDGPPPDDGSSESVSPAAPWARRCRAPTR